MSRPALLIKLLFAFVVGLSGALPAHAQGGPFAMWPEAPDVLVRDALATPYAHAHLKTFAANVRKDGEAACLQAKAPDEAALIERGRALLQVRAVQMLKILDENIDRAAYQAALLQAAGRGAVAEIERIKRDPDVKKLDELYRPIKLAKFIDATFEYFDRYLLIERIKLNPASPKARGESDSEATRANPVETTDAAVQDFLDKTSSPRIDRYLKLLDAVDVAMPKAVKKEAALKVGPMQYFAGADQDLAELCVGRR